MRLCLVGPTYPYRGGIAHYTTLLARHLRNSDEHELLFISFSRQYPGWLYRGRTDRDPSRHPLQAEAEYLLNPLHPLSWWRTLRRIGRWTPDAVVLPWWVPFWAPVWAALGRGIRRLPGDPRLLFICHNVLPHEQGALGRLFMPAVVRHTLSPGDGFIVHARSSAERLEGILPEARYRVTPHPSYAALGREKGGALPVAVPRDRPLLLFAGFVRPYKGLDVLLQALPEVLARRPAHLLVAGEFWQGVKGYRKQMAALGIAGAVTLLDAYLPDEQLSACVAAADVVVLPYRSATQSGVVQLAFGHGRPVITSDVDGLRDVVDHEQTGLLVPPEDPAALAAAINRFFDEDLGDAMRANIETQAGRFSWDRLLAALLELAQKA